MSTKKYTINSELTVLPGVGPSLISIFNKLGIYTVFDLLFYFPRDYKDYRKTTDLESIVENENITIKGKIIKSNLLRSRKRIYEVLLDDGTSKFKVISSAGSSLSSIVFPRVSKLSKEIVLRHPFPGPGLGIRILGEVTLEKVSILQEVDYIFISLLKSSGLYDSVWQAGAMLLPVLSVGVMGDERTYEYVVSLRAVSSTDGMTADWVHLPYKFLSKVSNEIINNVKGVNRVVYDISSKPPATIEWE